MTKTGVLKSETVFSGSCYAGEKINNFKLKEEAVHNMSDIKNLEESSEISPDKIRGNTFVSIVVLKLRIKQVFK